MPWMWLNALGLIESIPSPFSANAGPSEKAYAHIINALRVTMAVDT